MVAGTGTARNTDNLRIMVVNTPKTGNTWVKYPLADSYDLPVVPVGMVFDVLEIAGLGLHSDGHQHYAALAALCSCPTGRFVA